MRIGVGAGFSDDRVGPAVALAESGEIDYLVFECLAERTVARENLARTDNPEAGYTPRLIERMEAVLPHCLRHGIRIVTNMGAANPLAAARATQAVAQAAGLGPLSVATVAGDDVADLLRARPDLVLEDGRPIEAILPQMVSANAYLGAGPIVAALETGAQVVITGRVADPSLFLAPMVHHHGWAADDWPRIAAGTLAGHLLECSTQVSGGCFADPGIKEVPGLEDLGNPIGEIGADGRVVITKLAGTGGRVDAATCTEQLLYEMHDPAGYLTPDCVLDVTDVGFAPDGVNRICATGARAAPPTSSYKVTIGYHDGYIGEGEVSYAGINAVARAELAAEVVRARLARNGHHYSEMRTDLIGMSSLHGMGAGRPEPYEVRLRIAARCGSAAAARAVGTEIRAMHVNGPAGGGGGSDPAVRKVLAVASALIPRDLVRPQVHLHDGQEG
ncbi:acyclic terpene utilization AtuA family protein [Alkalilacustris brevis]|uniref:acyclic terpene utilization AtuA family protein n=1 Tax=Alkalilacustris brevis TaxID=2026338 RepID=UPI001EE4CBF2|nr:acyclic terpene utilization AtuA family protein [Alkalilacustris brevis]